MNDHANAQILSDFYQGWLIEISFAEGGFQIVCFSPCRERIRDFIPCKSVTEALKVAQDAVNWRMACQALSGFLRERFEAKGLCFEEWRSLHQSLLGITQAS
ncbi:MAG: hypothetical protein KME15_02205 [Drouetiella hepatica Uher 2000/2452]|uniref:Uncharacterized protein n=1 Tax=Drouetiella hepatica Uher 2000/2452 TaxID=904376 RepID=A0A951Q7S7_9CYAN|nr:hypothetical protein [Drouetiella hepatica Uher 2000/2452]